jgi:G3E family GTPase
VITLENLMQRKERFDYIIIETSGLADPGPLAATFWLDEEIDSDLYLDGVVTIVDAKHFLQHLDEVKPAGVINEAQRQVAFADRIIVNKIDLVTPEYVDDLEKRILGHNATAKIYRTERSRVILDALLDIHAFDLQRALEVDPHFTGTCDSEDAHHDHSKHSHSHSHDESVRTISFRTTGDVDLEKFKLWLGRLLWEEKSEDLFRAKGVLAVANEAKKYVLQSVHNLFEVTASPVSWKKDETRSNTMVFIGRRLDEEELHSAFTKECCGLSSEQKIELSKRMQDCSNERRMDDYFAFMDDAIVWKHSAAHFGVMEGKAAVRAMVEKFVSDVPDVRWHVDEYRIAEDGSVEFDFKRTGNRKDGSGSVNGGGHERLCWNADGKVYLIETRATL